MKVYIVLLDDEWEESRKICAVFVDRHSANDFVNKQANSADYDVEEWEVSE